MMLQKTVKANIFGLTWNKENLLRREYDNFQACLRGFDAPLYSATKQQAQRQLCRLKGKLKRKKYPLILRRDVYNIRETENKLARFWVKIPVVGVWGGVKVPIKVADVHEELLRTCSIREGKLIWKGDHWSLHISVMKEVEDTPQPPSTILAVDLGESARVTYTQSLVIKNKFYTIEKEVQNARSLLRDAMLTYMDTTTTKAPIIQAYSRPLMPNPSPSMRTPGSA
jgi:hypothetical protein